MDNPVRRPFPDDWEKKKHSIRSSKSTEPVSPRDPNAPDLKVHSNGSLGYVSDGEFITMYGPPKEIKDVRHMTITNKKAKWELEGKKLASKRSIELRIFGIVNTVVIDNLLFSCEHRSEDPDGLIFIQQTWPIDKDIGVRALHPGALRGEGAMVRSNPSRVYVIDDTLPRHARRGYLAVEGLAMVETFLGDFNMKSRFESYRSPSFVVEDTRAHVKPKGYYITARPSSEDPTRIICHLKERANGSAKNVLRALLPLKSPKLLREWVMAKFPDAQTLLFE